MFSESEEKLFQQYLHGHGVLKGSYQFIKKRKSDFFSPTVDKLVADIKQFLQHDERLENEDTVMNDLAVLHYYASLRFDEKTQALTLDVLWPLANIDEKKEYYAALVLDLLQEDETFFFDYLKSETLTYSQLDAQLTMLERMQQLIAVIDDNMSLYQPLKQSHIAKCMAWFHAKIEACCYYLQQLFAVQPAPPVQHLIVTDKLAKLMTFFNCPMPIDRLITWYDRDERHYRDSAFTSNACLLNWEPLAPITAVNWLLERSWQTYRDEINQKLTYHFAALKQWAGYAFRHAYWRFQQDPAAGVKAYLDVYQKVQRYTQNLSAAAWSSRVQAEKKLQSLIIDRKGFDKEKNLSHKKLYLDLLKDLDAPLMTCQLALAQVSLDCFSDIESWCTDKRIEQLHGCFKVLHKKEVAGYLSYINWLHHSCYDFNDSEVCVGHEMDQFNENKFERYHPEKTYTITDKLVDSLNDAPRLITTRYLILVHPDKYPEVLKPIADYCSQQLFALKNKIVQLNTLWGRSQWSMNHQATDEEPSEYAYETITPPSLPLDLTVLTLKADYIIELQTPDSEHLSKKITKTVKIWDLLCSQIRQETLDNEVNRYLWLRIQVMNKSTLSKKKEAAQIEKENEVIRQAIEVIKQEKEVIKQEIEVIKQEKAELKQRRDKERQEKEEFKQGRDKERQEKEEFKQGRDKERQEKEEFKQERDKERQEKAEITEELKQKDVKIAKFLAIAKNNLRADFRQSFASQPIYQANFFTSIKDDQRYKAIVAAKKADPAYENCFDDEQVFDEVAFEAYQSYQPS